LSRSGGVVGVGGSGHQTDHSALKDLAEDVQSNEQTLTRKDRLLARAVTLLVLAIVLELAGVRMSAMESSTADQPAASETMRADATESSRTEKAYGDRNFKPMTLPSLVGPDFLIPASVSKLFRKLFRRKDTSASR